MPVSYRRNIAYAANTPRVTAEPRPEPIASRLRRATVAAWEAAGTPGEPAAEAALVAVRADLHTFLVDAQGNRVFVDKRTTRITRTEGALLKRLEGSTKDNPVDYRVLEAWAWSPRAQHPPKQPRNVLRTVQCILNQKIKPAAAILSVHGVGLYLERY